jgi:non-specific protein-tyrosine kinase
LDTPLPVVSEPKGPASEAYRNLRTGFQFLASQRGYKTLLVTSPSAHEGKTSTVANLGVALSQAGRRVVIVSADLRRPSLEKTFGAESDLGLSTWLLGEEEDLRNLVLEHPDIPNLSLMTAGRIPSNPAELLTSPRLRELIDRLTQYFDLVLFDSPPVLPVADAVILASHLDSVILIFDAASTGRSAALHAKEQIERVGGNIIGCVLNAFDPSNTPYYYEPYYYSAYYGPSEGEGADGDAPGQPSTDDEDMLGRRRRMQN